MRWPWQKREPDPADEEIAERMVEHQRTLKRVGRVLREATVEIGRTAQLMDKSPTELDEPPPSKLRKGGP